MTKSEFLAQENVPEFIKAMGHVDVISGTVSQLYNFLANEPKEGKEVRLPKD